MNKKLFLVVVLFISLVSSVLAETNGVWHRAEDVVPGTFGTDEVKGDYSFINSKVGIGVTIPTALLHVKSNGDTFMKLETTSNSNTTFLTFSENDVKQWSIGQNPSWNLGSNDFYIYKEGTWNGVSKNLNGLVIEDATGNIGIGIINPSYKFQIVGSSYPQLVIQDVNTDNTNKHSMIGGGHYKTSEEPVAMIYSYSNATSNEIAIGGQASQMNSATEIKFYTASNTNTIIGTTRMIIDRNGNVGIGTWNPPAAKLEVNGKVLGEEFCFESGGCLSVQ